MYNFEIYTGQENNYRIEGEENLGASANIVVRLCRPVPKNIGHKVFCDNYFTTIPLALFLEQQGILCIGTIRRNRIPNSKLKTDREIGKLPRGSYEEYTASFEGTDLGLVQWKDNKSVTLVSSYVGANPVSLINRWDSKKRAEVAIKCPEIIKHYNRHMGGVDLHDSFIGRCHIKYKSSKWYHRIFFHMVDVTIVNSWIIHRKICKETNQQALTLVNYRKCLGQALCIVGSGRESRNNSASSRQLTKELIHKSRNKSAQNIPIKDIRLDQTNHFPVWGERVRCKMPKCKSQTFIKCLKCNVSLCINKTRNCFLEFHK